jgi:hypothetical protein
MYYIEGSENVVIRQITIHVKRDVELKCGDIINIIYGKGIVRKISFIEYDEKYAVFLIDIEMITLNTYAENDAYIIIK